MKLLVTGASGHLGRALRIALAADTSMEVLYWTSPRAPGDSGVAVDLASPNGISPMVRQFAPDAVIHLASITGAACDREPDRAERVNVEATRQIARAAAQAGAVRFVFASTSALYGDAHDSPVSEDAPLSLSSEYARSKLAAEHALDEVGHQYRNFSSVALRIFNIYGDGFTDSLVARLLRSTQGEPVAVRGPDNFVRDYVHSSDVVTALLSALRAPMEASLTSINIGAGEPVSNRELLRSLERASHPYYSIVSGPDSYSCANIALARALLEFAPASLEDALAVGTSTPRS